MRHHSKFQCLTLHCYLSHPVRVILYDNHFGIIVDGKLIIWRWRCPTVA